MGKYIYPEDRQISENITLCRDGKYRWQYDLNLFTNLSIFFLVWKILFCIFLVIFGLVVISDIVNFGITPERVEYDGKFLLYFLIGMTVVSALGYIVYSLIMGGKYCVIFEMDEKGINHKQIPTQAKKAKKIAALTSAAGAATGSLTTIGVGMNAARTEMYTEFSRVRRVKSYPSRKLIKLNCKLSRNQIYVSKEDFDFVNDFILNHCENVK